MEKRILILGNSIDRSIYRPVEEWSRYLGDVPFDAVQLPLNEPVPSLDRYTHVLLTGSDASLTKPEPWFDAEADVVRDAMDRGLAVLGSCFGHQMLAWVLSGPEYVRRAPIPELGWVAVEMSEEDSGQRQRWDEPRGGDREARAAAGTLHQLHRDLVCQWWEEGISNAARG